MKVKIKVLSNGQGLELPKYATQFSAGVDLRAAVENLVVLKPGKFQLVPTGIAIALPVGFEAQVRPRSGLAVKFGVTVLNSPGTIDTDYRGEIKVCLINFGESDFVINRGDRIAQMIIAQFVCAHFETATSLDETERSEGGFGSTGAR